MNNNTLQMIELARVLDSDRIADTGRPTSLRAGPDRRVRTRIGRRLIAAGERIAYGTTKTATR